MTILIVTDSSVPGAGPGASRKASLMPKMIFAASEMISAHCSGSLAASAFSRSSCTAGFHSVEGAIGGTPTASQYSKADRGEVRMSTSTSTVSTVIFPAVLAIVSRRDAHGTGSAGFCGGGSVTAIGISAMMYAFMSGPSLCGS